MIRPAPDGAHGLLWGLGFDLGFPTATEDILGTGKWLAGPSGLGVYLGPKWKVGALVQQYWDYAGDRDRDDVSLMNLHYSINQPYDVVGQEWNFRFYVIPAVPSALFKWMD